MVFIRQAGMTHVRTSPYYPQSNGKLERWHQTMKVTAIRPNAPQSLEEALRLMERFVEYYNHRRLHSAIALVTPADMLAGRAESIWAARDQKLEAARARRRALWQADTETSSSQEALQPTIVSAADANPSPQLRLAVH